MVRHTFKMCVWLFYDIAKKRAKRQTCRHIETSQLICFVNQLTGFHMMATSVFNLCLTSELNIDYKPNPKYT